MAQLDIVIILRNGTLLFLFVHSGTLGNSVRWIRSVIITKDARLYILPTLEEQNTQIGMFVYVYILLKTSFP